MAIVRVPYVGGPLEYRDGERQFEEFDRAELVEGVVFDWPETRYTGDTAVRVERYVLTKTGTTWTNEYEGTFERPAEAGDLPAVNRDISTRVADGPHAGGLVVIGAMETAHPEQYNTLEYKRTRFGDTHAEHYELRSTPEGWRWFWMGPAA